MSPNKGMDIRSFCSVALRSAQNVGKATVARYYQVEVPRVQIQPLVQVPVQPALQAQLVLQTGALCSWLLGAVGVDVTALALERLSQSKYLSG